MASHPSLQHLPIWGLFWGFIAGEQIRWTALAGVVVVLAGLVLLNLRFQPQPAAVIAAPRKNRVLPSRSERAQI